MDLQLRDKVVLVSGVAKGIGAAIAAACAAEGAIPILIDRDTAAGEQLQSRISASGGAAHFISGDLSDVRTCEDCARKAAAFHDRLDALVNNAGINDRVGLESGTPDQFIASLQRNLFDYYNMAHYALPYLKKRRCAIVNISSKTALMGQGGTSGYIAAKGAILALTREWAADLLPYGIRVNAVVPAEVMTPLYEQWLKGFLDASATLKVITEKIPLGHRMTAPEEIAAMVLFLISPRSSHTTGKHVFVDGGYVHLDRALT